jgi:Flp pilus assembly protein TadG
MAEFALIVPVLLTMIFGIVDLGRVIWANDMVSNAAREGARYASVHGDSELTVDASKDDIRAHTVDQLIAAGNDPVVEVCYSTVAIAASTTGCTGNTDGPGAVNERGALVTVRVTTTVPILTGSLLGLGDFTITGTSTVLINN